MREREKQTEIKREKCVQQTQYITRMRIYRGAVLISVY